MFCSAYLFNTFKVNCLSLFHIGLNMVYVYYFIITVINLTRNSSAFCVFNCRHVAHVCFSIVISMFNWKSDLFSMLSSVSLSSLDHMNGSYFWWCRVGLMPAHWIPNRTAQDSNHVLDTLSHYVIPLSRQFTHSWSKSTQPCHPLYYAGRQNEE